MASKIYINPETVRTWADTGGDEDLDLGSLASGAGRVGSFWDLGASARAFWYGWQLDLSGFATSPVIGATVELYLAFSEDASIITGPVGYSDTADSALVSTNLLPNLIQIGVAIVRSTTASDDITISGRAIVNSRYISPVIYNNTQDALLGSGDTHTFKMWAIPPESQ